MNREVQQIRTFRCPKGHVFDIYCFEKDIETMRCIIVTNSLPCYLISEPYERPDGLQELI